MSFTNRFPYPMCSSLSHDKRHPVPLTLSHRQLRDLIICPDERGMVNYVQDQCIMEHDISDPSSVSLLTVFFTLSRFVWSHATPLPAVWAKKERNRLEKGGEWRVS